MYLIERTLGNINSHGALDLSAEDIKHDVLVLEQWEAQKSRCRKKVNSAMISVYPLTVISVLMMATFFYMTKITVICLRLKYSYGV